MSTTSDIVRAVPKPNTERRPVPVPAFIFRGHQASIHALRFFDGNRFLVSGDSDGWLIIWSTATKRAVASWKAHDSGVSGIGLWERTTGKTQSRSTVARETRDEKAGDKEGPNQHRRQLGRREGVSSDIDEARLIR